MLGPTINHGFHPMDGLATPSPMLEKRLFLEIILGIYIVFCCFVVWFIGVSVYSSWLWCLLVCSPPPPPASPPRLSREWRERNNLSSFIVTHFDRPTLHPLEGSCRWMDGISETYYFLWFFRPVSTGPVLGDCLTITSLFTTFGYATTRLDLVPTFSLKFNETVIRWLVLVSRHNWTSLRTQTRLDRMGWKYHVLALRLPCIAKASAAG